MVDAILTAEDLDAIEARHAAATGGAWMGGPEAEAAGHWYPDWGLVWAHTPSAERPFTLVVDCCHGGVASEEEKSECRAKSIDLWRSGAGGDWVEPAQVAANRAFIEAAHNTDVPRLIATVRALLAANERAKRLLTADLSVLRMGPADHGFTLDTAGRMVAVIAGELATWLREHHAANYTETALEQIEVSGGASRYIVTVQRGDGKSPHQLRREAEGERDEARAEVARLEADLAEMERRDAAQHSANDGREG
ncbi:hypothetical protein [Azospirillum canadense]|uniref:hypothetical protein n=1 Tax=Azospirillum canadense TaxID=403962 RepID=UPI002227FBB7|nr:hypothetical protein [Azospirillum canadense]MCW2242213.1 hypothetical protein [Azospirillum canadense]